MDNLTKLDRNDFHIRPAVREDIAEIHAMLLELAEYEGILSRMVATPQLLEEALFARRAAEAIVGFYREAPVAFAIYYPHFATFRGRVALYMEELYVREVVRGRGAGKRMIAFLAKLALDRGYFRLEWPCMADNFPAQEFYQRLGAYTLSDRMLFRLSEENLSGLAALA